MNFLRGIKGLKVNFYTRMTINFNQEVWECIVYHHQLDFFLSFNKYNTEKETLLFISENLSLHKIEKVVDHSF